MDSIFKPRWPGKDGHPSEDQLLLFVDGELTSKELSSVRAHLEACWSCRVRTEKIEETISSFIDYRNQVLKPLVEPPPHGWRGFGSKLGSLVAQVGSPSLLSNIRSALGRILSAANFSFTLEAATRAPVLARAVVSIVILSLTLSLALYLNRPPTVSASELLKHATEAQTARLLGIDQPVVYQKLEVRSRDRASQRESTANWEIWSDSTNARFRHSVNDGSGRRFLPLPGKAENETVRFPDVLIELGEILRANNMDPQRPLSPASYLAWRNSLSQRKENVGRSFLPNGLEILTLQTTPAGIIDKGRISDAVMVVRARDWHPGELRLQVKFEEGMREYEIVEAAYEVVSLTTLNTEIFPEEKGEVAAAVLPAEPPAKGSPQTSLNSVNPSVIPGASALAPLEAEVEVLHLLSQAGADLGEQINVSRMPDGRLLVKGIVGTEERKSELIRVLQPVMSQPSVRVEIRTVAEALTHERQTVPGPEVRTEQKVEIAGNSIAAAPELRSYFVSRSERVDEEIRQYASRMVRRSHQAMRHLYALKRLSSQFSAEELRALNTEARSKWLALIRKHAQAFQAENASLRKELEPVFFATTPQKSGQGGPDINDATEIAGAIEVLFDLGSANDRVVRSAFAISARDTMVTAVKTPQFWQSLLNAEALASRIQSVKL
jgi:hypothetical protein